MGSAGLLFGGAALLNQNGQLTSALQSVSGALKLNPSGYSRFDEGIQLLDKVSIDPSGAINALTGSFRYSQFADAVKIGTLSLTLSNDQIIWTSNTVSNMVLTSNALTIRNNLPFTFSNANVIYTCNVGVGTSNPLGRLSIQNGNLTITNATANNSNGHNHGGIVWYGLNRGLGNASAKVMSASTRWDDGGNLTFHTSPGLDDGFERMRITEEGDVGIGTTSPGHKLDVAGTVRCSNVISSNITTSNLSITTGNVGIGTTTLCNRLNVSGTTSTTSLELSGTKTSWTNGAILLNNAMSSASTTQGYFIGRGFSTDTRNHIVIHTDSSEATAGVNFMTNNLVSRLFINSSNGRVGIGTTSPAHSLDVAGSVRCSNVISSNITTSNITTSNLSITTGNLGIGMTPVYRLDVNGLARINGDFQSTLSIATNSFMASNAFFGTSSPDNFSRLTVALPPSGNTIASFTKIRIINDSPPNPNVFSPAGITSTSEATGLGLYSPSGPITMRVGTGFDENIRIQLNGNVGIRTSNPQYRLDVNGTMRVSSSTLLSESWMRNLGLYLRGEPDRNHGIIYNTALDGARVFGFSGGALGFGSGSNALVWRNSEIGIGKDNPAYRLDVNGDINTSSNLRENGVLLSTKYTLSNTMSNYSPLTQGIFSSNIASWTSNNYASLSNTYYSTTYNTNDRYWTWSNNTVFTNSNVSISNLDGLRNINIPNNQSLDINNANNQRLFRLTDGQFGFFAFSREVIASCNLSIGGQATISQNNFLEFGKNIPGKEASAGRIAYQLFSCNLDIVGAGDSFANNRKVKIWDTLVANSIEAEGNLSIQAGLNSHIFYGNSNVSRIGMYGSGRFAFNRNLNINGGNIGENKNGWQVSIDNESNLSFYRADNQNYFIQSGADGSSNILSLSRNGNLTIQRGNLFIYNNNNDFSITPGFKAGVANSNWVDFDTRNGGGIFIWENLEVGLNMSANSKNFKIQHPVDPKKKLVHSCIEAPQNDLIYSGTVKLNKGEAIVKIDSASCPHSPMTEGTFEALTHNARVHLQNNDGFTAVKGKIVGGELHIKAQNKSCDDEIHWFIIAERRDEGIRKCSTTDDIGHLITEY
jgi:hypothetical protein